MEATKLTLRQAIRWLVQHRVDLYDRRRTDLTQFTKADLEFMLAHEDELVLAMFALRRDQERRRAHVH